MAERLKGSVEEISPGRWRLRVTTGYNKKGNPIRESDVVDAKNRRKAEQALEDFIEELEEHGYKNIRNITLKAFFEDTWIKDAKTLLDSDAAYQGYKSIMEKRFIPEIGDEKLREIRPFQIRKIIDGATYLKDKDKPVSRKTKQRFLNVIAHVLNLAKKEYTLIDSNPAANIEFTRRTGEKKHVYPPYNLKEINQLFKVLKTSTAPLKDRVMIYTAIITGARLGEITALQESDFDHEEKMVWFHQRIVSQLDDEGIQHWVRKDGLKNADEKTMAVPEDYLKMVRQLCEENARIRKKLKVNPDRLYLFNDERTGSHCVPQSLRRQWTRFIQAEGLRYIRFHDLRHTSASYLVAKNTVPTKVIQERLGHASYKTTMDMYVTALDESDRDAADTFGDAISSVDVIE